jgi:hypothetical protein
MTALFQALRERGVERHFIAAVPRYVSQSRRCRGVLVWNTWFLGRRFLTQLAEKRTQPNAAASFGDGARRSRPLVCDALRAGIG